MAADHELDRSPRPRPTPGRDRDALEAVLRAIQDDVHRLAVRMLWHPADAEDATQEILVKIVTRLDEFAADLADGLDEPYDAGGVDERLLEEEVKVGCTQAMLLCLDRDHRAAWVLGEVFELPGDEAAAILEIAPAAYRKRLSRARQRIQAFMRGHCGLVDAANACRRTRRVGAAMRRRRVDPQNPLFARDVREGVRGMERLHDAAAVFRSHPELQAPEELVPLIVRTLERPGEHGRRGERVSDEA